MKIKKYLILCTCLVMAFLLTSCGKDENTAVQTPIEVINDIEDGDDISIVVEPIPDEDEEEEIGEEIEGEDEEGEDAEDSESEDEGDVTFNPDDAFSYCSKVTCKYDDSEVKFNLEFDGGIPKSDDNRVYLFEVSTYESESSFGGKEPVASAEKQSDMTFTVDYTERYLFSRFVPTLLIDGEYVPIANGKYINNPQALASYTKSYPNVKSKKGFLVDTTTIGTDKLSSLNVSRVIYNIPLSYIMGETEAAANPTINFEYNGTTYHFNGYKIMLFDSLFTNLTNQGYHCTAIILNDWNSKYPDMMHPKSRQKTGSSLYYAFNTEEEDGVRRMEAAALFLADRYSTGKHGMVYDWVIANEMNQHKIWNYMDTDDVYYYTESFERSFRTFYNAIKSTYSHANVYFSIDHDWNDNDGNNSKFFNGKDILYTFNKVARMRGNYDWGLAIHPYPDPLPKVRFWEGEFDKSENARVVTPMNLSSLTSVLRKDEFLDTNGSVRKIAITELGFTSNEGENLQAAAYAYAYYIIDHNKYINSFIMNRQTDDPQEMQSGMALGVYRMDLTPKYLAEVFAKIDSGSGSYYTSEMLNIIGASSLDEALSWAN